MEEFRGHIGIDTDMRERHLVESFFLKLMVFSGAVTRYDKLAPRFLAFTHFTCIRILLA